MNNEAIEYSMNLNQSLFSTVNSSFREIDIKILQFISINEKYYTTN